MQAFNSASSVICCYCNPRSQPKLRDELRTEKALNSNRVKRQRDSNLSPPAAACFEMQITCWESQKNGDGLKHLSVVYHDWDPSCGNICAAHFFLVSTELRNGSIGELFMFNKVCYPKESDMLRSDMKGFTVFSCIFLNNTNFENLRSRKNGQIRYG